MFLSQPYCSKCVSYYHSKRCVCYATIGHERSVSTNHASKELHFKFSHKRSIVAIAEIFITPENGSARQVVISKSTYLHCYHYRLPTQCRSRPKWLKTETDSSLRTFKCLLAPLNFRPITTQGPFIIQLFVVEIETTYHLIIPCINFSHSCARNVDSFTLSAITSIAIILYSRLLIGLKDNILDLMLSLFKLFIFCL